MFACQPVATSDHEHTHVDKHKHDSSEITKTYLHPTNGYSQVVSVSAHGVKTLYISGQLGEGDDLASQMRAALGKLETELQSAGASFKDIVKMNTYIVDYEEEDLETFRNVRKEVMGDTDMPASTLVGVTSLAYERFLIEIEAVAVIAEGTVGHP